METLWAVEKRLVCGGNEQALFVASMWLLFVFQVVSLAPGFAGLRVSLPRSTLCSLLYHLVAGFLAWKGLLEVIGSFG